MGGIKVGKELWEKKAKTATIRDLHEASERGRDWYPVNVTTPKPKTEGGGKREEGTGNVGLALLDLSLDKCVA